MKKRTRAVLCAVLAVALLFVTALLGYGLWEGAQLEVTHRTLVLERAPAALTGLRILQISDLHGGRLEDESFLSLIESESPDMIAITGDLLDASQVEKIERISDFCSRLVNLCPVYYVSGNHEGRGGLLEELSASLRTVGVHVIDNAEQTLSFGGETLRIVGLSDPTTHHRPADYGHDYAGQMEEVLRDAALTEEQGVIVLVHRPDYLETYASFPVDLVLCGHTHGGQVCLPGGQALIAPGQGLFPEYSAGLYEHAGTQMYVSRGLASGLRINCLPELAVITLQCTGK